MAAWAVAPGFYDGIAPPQPYRWACPPAGLGAGNQPPQGGSGVARVGTQGVVDPGTAFSADGQAALSFLPGTFATPPDRSPVRIDIQPQPGCPSPSPGALRIATNVYCFTSTSPLVPGKQPLVTLQFSTHGTAPSDVYQVEGNAWRKIGSTGSAAPYYIAARTTSLGCFAGGYVPGRSPTGPGSGVPALPIVTGLAVAIVLLAGVPLLVQRRRGRRGRRQRLSSSNQWRGRRTSRRTSGRRSSGR